MIRSPTRPAWYALSLLAVLWPAIACGQSEPMTFQLVRPAPCHGACAAEMIARGWITADSAEQFRALASTQQAGVTVRLSSPGGNLIGGLLLGDALREAGVGVIVGPAERCVSACLYAFLGGTSRRAAPGRIGVHRFVPEAGGDFPDVLAQRTTQTLSAYLARMGAAPELLPLILGVTPPALHFLDAAELRRLRVVN
jgi:hypothetical protein